MENPKIYVASLSDYNEGKLIGQWFDLTEFSSYEDFMTAISDYLEELNSNDDGTREEWAFHDSDNISRIFVSEYYINPIWWDLQEIGEETLNAFIIYCEHNGYQGESLNLEAFQSFSDDYIGYCDSYNPQLDFAHQLIDETDLIERMGDLSYYFDYEAYARDLFMSDYWESEGYIFRS